jgi:hypothetical protein
MSALSRRPLEYSFATDSDSHFLVFPSTIFFKIFDLREYKLTFIAEALQRGVCTKIAAEGSKRVAETVPIPLNSLAYDFEEEVYKRGETIFEQGQQASRLYLVRSG